jgi:hypothetical protein
MLFEKFGNIRAPGVQPFYSNCRITDVGAAAISKSLEQNKKLKELQVRDEVNQFLQTTTVCFLIFWLETIAWQ